MELFIHPTQFSGVYPNGWGGFTWLDWDASSGSYHPADDYNYGVGGDDDFNQPVYATYKGTVVYSGSDTVGYGNMIVIKHTLNDKQRKFIKDNYGIDTKELYSLYAHLNVRYYQVGNSVATGAFIGRLGKSGTKWSHLHFELYKPNGDLANKPWRFYPIGWSQALIKKNWVPAYLFIENYRKFLESDTTSQKCKIAVGKLKVAIDRLKTELDTDLANSNYDCDKVLSATMSKVNKIAETGTL